MICSSRFFGVANICLLGRLLKDVELSLTLYLSQVPHSNYIKTVSWSWSAAWSLGVGKLGINT